MSQDKKHLDSKVSEQDISASKIAKCVKEEPHQSLRRERTPGLTPCGCFLES